MKKGISMWTFSDRNPHSCFALAQKYGFDGVEVALGESGPVRFDSTKEELEEYRRIAENYGIAFYSLVCDSCWSYSLTSSSSKSRETAEAIIIKQLETACLLGCDTILVLPGMVQALSSDSEVVPYDLVWKRSLEALKRLAVYGEKYGVVIGVENVWNKFLLSPLEMRNFLGEIGSPWVKAYFDVGNVVYTGFPEQWIRILGNRIAKVHFKDYVRADGTANGFVDILKGDVDYEAVMVALKEVGYDDWVTAEVFPANGDVEDTLSVNSVAMDKILGRV